MTGVSAGVGVTGSCFEVRQKRILVVEIPRFEADGEVQFLLWLGGCGGSLRRAERCFGAGAVRYTGASGKSR